MLSSTPLGGLLARIAEMVQPRVTTRLLLTYDDPNIREPAQGSASSLSSDAALNHYSFTIGSIRPYLVAACKWYSEADAGPGAESGAGFRD